CCVASVPTHPSPPELYSLSLHDALPISAEADARADWKRVFCTTARPHDLYGDEGSAPGGVRTLRRARGRCSPALPRPRLFFSARSEEHTSELQSRENLVCRLLLEKKNTR